MMVTEVLRSMVQESFGSCMTSTVSLGADNEGEIFTLVSGAIDAVFSGRLKVVCLTLWNVVYFRTM